MKKSLLTLSLLFISFSFAQELQFKKGKVLQNDTKLSNSEIKSRFHSNEKAIALYTKSKEKGAYNTRLQDTTLNPDLEMHFVTNSNGLGLKLNF